jgi:hypothetical protein
MSWRMNNSVKQMTHGTTGRRLNANEKLVLLTLSDYYNEELRFAWVSMERLARETACEVRSLRRILRRLEIEHRILMITISTGRGKSNEYRFSEQSGLFSSVEKPVQSGANPAENRAETRTLSPGGLMSADRGVPEKGSGESAQLDRTKTKTPYSPPAGDETRPRVLNRPSYLHHHGQWIEVHMGATRRLFSRDQWSSMAGIHISGLLDNIQARGYRARIVPAEEVATWKEERTA